MKWSAVEKQKFRIQVERILHVPGNFTQEILEMALVLDCRIPKEELQSAVQEIAGALKQQSEVFRNVRLNLIDWEPGRKPESRTVPLPMLMLGRLEGDERICRGEPEAEELFRYLKLFQARSKLILVLSAGGVRLGDSGSCRTFLKPFLGRKLLWMAKGEEPEIGPFLQKERAAFLQFPKEQET